MKKIGLFFTVLFCAVALVLMLPADVPAAEVIKMKIGHANKPDSPRDIGAKLFAKLIKERTGGRVVVEVYPSAQLGSNRQMVEQTQMGSLECLIMPTAFFGGFNRMVTIVDLPFIYPTIDVFYKVMNGPFGEELLKEVEKIKLVGLGYWTSGWKQFTTNFPVHTPSDYKGHKIRTMPAPVLMEQYRSYGASAIPTAYAELYNALQLGTVEGQENPLYAIEEMKFYEVQKYITVSHHAILPEIILVSKTWWDTVPEDIQKKIIDTFREISPTKEKWIEEKDAAALKVFEKHGNVVYTLTPAERAEFAKLAPVVWKKFVTEYGGKSQYYLDKLQAAVKAAQ